MKGPERSEGNEIAFSYRKTPSGLFVAAIDRPGLREQPSGLQEAIDSEGDSYGYIDASHGRVVVHTHGLPAKSHAPIFYLHGSPGWGGGPVPLPRRLIPNNIFLIAPTRGGYYESRTAYPPDAAKDVAAIAKAMGIEKYFVIGRSGGGLHALKVLRDNGDAVLGAGLLVTPTPFDLMEESLFEGMVEQNAEIRLQSDAEIIDESARRAYQAAFQNTGPGGREEDMFRYVPPHLSTRSRLEIHQLGIAPELQRSYTKAYGDGGLGWAYDTLAMKHGLRDVFGQVDGSKVILHYDNPEDEYVPQHNGKTLQRLIPGSVLFPTPEEYEERRSFDEFAPYSFLGDTYRTHFGAFADLIRVVSELRFMHKEKIQGVPQNYYH